MGKGEGAVLVGESGGRRRRRLGEDGDDDDEEYVLEEEEEYEEDLSASSADEGGESSGKEYEQDEDDETPRLRQPVKGRENGRKGKADPAVVRSRRRKYDDDDDYLEDIEEDEGVDEYDEDLEEDEEAPRPKREKKCGGRSVKGKVPPERSKRRRYEEDMDFDPDMDEEEEEEDMDFDSEVEEEEEDFEDEEEDELEASMVRVKNMTPRKSALNQRSGKKKSSSNVSCWKVGSVKARKASSVRRQQRKCSMIDHYEDDDFIVEDEVTANRQPRKKARIRRQVEVDPPTPVFEAETWPTIDSDATDFDFVTSDEEAAIAEPTRVSKKGRKKRVFMSYSSSDSEFISSDKELGDLRESEPLESLKVLPSSPKKISITGNGEYKGKEKREPQETGRATCGICLSEEQRVTVQGVLDCCSHYFCFGCIMQWCKVESRCPLCKRRLTTITKLSKVDTGLELTKSVIRVEERDQVYQPMEEEIRRWLDPYENVVCIECNQGGDDSLMLLCDICDSSAHTYCVGLGREVPEGNWYCGGCRLGGEGHSYHSPVNAGVFGAISPIGTFERQGIDLNLSPREIPRGNRSVECQASTAGASTPSRRHANAMNSGRRQIHDWIRNLLSRPRTTLRPDMHCNSVQQSGYVPSTEPDHMNFCTPLESDTSHNTGSVPRSEPNQNYHLMSEANISETSFGRNAALSERRQLYERFCMLLSRPSPTIRPDLCHIASEHGGSVPRVEPNHMNFHASPVANSPQTMLDGIPNHSNGFSFTQAHSNFVDGNNFQETEGV